jgi:hypothetical protein
VRVWYALNGHVMGGGGDDCQNCIAFGSGRGSKKAVHHWTACYSMVESMRSTRIHVKNGTHPSCTSFL